LFVFIIIGPTKTYLRVEPGRSKIAAVAVFEDRFLSEFVFIIIFVFGPILQRLMDSNKTETFHMRSRASVTLQIARCQTNPKQHRSESATKCISSSTDPLPEGT